MKCEMLSVSRGNTYLQCPLKYWYQYEEGVRQEADFFDIGNIVHAVLERLFKDYEGMIDLESLKELLEEEMVKNPRLSSPKHYKECLEMLETFVCNGNNFMLPTLKMNGEPALELSFFIDLITGELLSEHEARNAKGRYIFRGFIDKIEKVDEDTIRVLDYKTSWVAKTESELQDDLQLEGYNYAARVLFPEYENVELALHFLRHDKTVSVMKTKKDAEMTRRGLLCLMKSIEKDDKPTPNLNQYCHYCPVRDECKSYKEVLEGKVQVPNLSKATSSEELWNAKQELTNKYKILEKKIKEIDERFKEHFKNSDSQEIELSEGKLYLADNRRSFYPFEAILEVLPTKDLSKVVTVRKGKVESLLGNDEEKMEFLRARAVYYNQQPTLRFKKHKKY